nr:CDP-glycerol:glycerophosphate glycerophosphotransferase [Aquibacillus saliphilus]
MKKVSIIVPVYNTSEFLDDCISSIINQTYQELEILVVNDGSDESSSEKCKEIQDKDSRIKYFSLAQKSGVGAARNYGIKKSTGEYIYFLDSDDYLAEDGIEILVNSIKGRDIISGKMKKTNLSRSEVLEKDLNEDENELGYIPSLQGSESVNLDISDAYVYQKKRGEVFRNGSIIHRLIAKKFVEKYDLKFSEEITNYSDFSLIIPILVHNEEIPYQSSSVYFKRRRNDPISNPSISQLPIEQRISDFLTSYLILREKYQSDDVATAYLDNHLLEIYRKQIVTAFKNPENIDYLFDQLKKCIIKVDSKRIKSNGIILRREVNALKIGDIDKYKSISKNHHRLRYLKQAIRSRQKLYLYLYRTIFMRQPIKENLVVFESFLGKNYSDNPKHIYEYMVKNNYNCEYVWIFNETDKEIPGNAKQVKRSSLKYYYYLARAKYWVSNSRMPKQLNKREGNIYLQTWHGTPLKKLVFDMKDVHSANPNYKRDFYIQSRRWDYLVSPNKYSSEVFKSAFKYEEKLLEFGYPRNDILYTQNNASRIQELKKKLKIPANKKVILYAPTWRDNEYFGAGKYKFTLKLDLEKMNQQLGDEYVVVLRMHYFIANQLDISEFENFAYDLSKYDDIAELYLISDILITDYSSVFFDYANLKRPILFFTYDLELYQDTLRGFYFDIEKEAPGPLLKTTNQVIDSIHNVDELNVDYKERYQRFYDKFCSWDDGHASEKVVKKVFNKN